MIADQVFQQLSGKWCIIGAFDRIFAPRFPAVHPSLALFVEIADAVGDYDVAISFCNSKDQILSALPGMRLNVKDRLVPAKFGIQTYGLPIPAPGRYSFKLYFNGELIPMDTALDAVLMESNNG